MRRWAGVASLLGIGIGIVFPMFTARAQDDAVAVEIQDNYYSPAEIHVPAGGTVTWTDLGGAHSVTSGDNGVEFDSSPGCVAGLNCMATGDTFSHQFGGPERVTYHCRIHGNAMVGTIVVDPASATSSTSTTSTTSSTTTTTTLASTTTSTDASGAPSTDSAAPTLVSQPSLPQPPSAPGSRALPRAVARSAHTDDVRPWALLAVIIAAGTTLAGIVLVRQGRVPFG